MNIQKYIKGSDSLAHVYLMLSATSSMLSAAIGTFTKKKYNHISISFDEELNEVYSFGRLNPNNAFIGGFSRERVTSNFYLKAKIQLYKLEVTDEEMESLRMIVQRYDKHQDLYYYNLLGLITAWLKIPWERPNTYFCSEFISTLLIEADVLTRDFIPSITTPHEIIDALNPPMHFEGFMWQYKLQDLPKGYVQRFKNFVQIHLT